jgi:large subunit ribosomal protein L24
MQRIKKGDTVMVIAGKQKGTTAEVMSVDPKSDKAVVQGVHVVTKHQKPSNANPQGGIVKREAPVHLSNLMPIDPQTKKATRISIKTLADGTKVRVAKSGEQLDK